MKTYYIINTHSRDIRKLSCGWTLLRHMSYQFGGLTGTWRIAEDYEVEENGCRDDREVIL